MARTLGEFIDPYLRMASCTFLVSSRYPEVMLEALLLALTIQNPPDLQKVAAAGQASAKRMADRQAVWTATHTLENGASIDVHVIRQGNRQSVVLRVGQQDFGRLIIRDGIWYVSDSLGPRKHR